MEVRIGQFLVCDGGDDSGVCLLFTGRSNLSVLINDWFWVLKQLPHGHVLFIYFFFLSEKVSVWFIFN